MGRKADMAQILVADQLSAPEERDHVDRPVHDRTV